MLFAEVEEGALDALDIFLQAHIKDAVAVGHLRGDQLQTLLHGQLTADHTLQGPLHFRKTGITECHRKTDDAGFADAALLRQRDGGQKRGRLVIFQNVFCDFFVGLAHVGRDGVNTFERHELGERLMRHFISSFPVFGQVYIYHLYAEKASQSCKT